MPCTASNSSGTTAERKIVPKTGGTRASGAEAEGLERTRFGRSDIEKTTEDDGRGTESQEHHGPVRQKRKHAVQREGDGARRGTASEGPEGVFRGGLHTWFHEEDGRSRAQSGARWPERQTWRTQLQQNVSHAARGKRSSAHHKGITRGRMMHGTRRDGGGEARGKWSSRVSNSRKWAVAYGTQHCRVLRWRHARETDNVGGPIDRHGRGDVPAREALRRRTEAKSTARGKLSTQELTL